MLGKERYQEKAQACAYEAEKHEYAYIKRKRAVIDSVPLNVAYMEYEQDKAIAEDRECQMFAAQNRWYISQATMYALLAIMER
jgi:hypothetical protein